MVRISASVDHEAIVCVQDSGSGISAEDLPHIFERLRRGGNSDGQLSNGFGLGLAICKAIVEAYGGTIEVKSDQGKGTKVFVRIPAESAAAGASAETPVKAR